MTPGLFFLLLCLIPFVAVVIYGWRAGSEDKKFKYGSYVTITRQEWERIEKNMAKEIARAKEEAYKNGCEHTYKMMEMALHKKENERKDPYTVIGLTYYDKDKFAKRIKLLKRNYHPRNFKHLDEDFVNLAKVRVQEIEEASAKIVYERMKWNA